MISYTSGNLLEDNADALVNTVNTVGVMGKGIALMFKEAFPENFKAYKKACDNKEVVLGKMFVTCSDQLIGPKWIVNFPTKGHWRYPTRMEWVEKGLEDLKKFIIKNEIKSIAIPPLGAGNGGLNWCDVKPKIVKVIGSLDDVQVTIYEPTAKYQNVAKRSGVEKLTPARALVVEMIRRYWVLGIECSLLEIQKLAWFLENIIEEAGLDNPLKLNFTAHKFGPYANRLEHLLNSLDGSYLKCDKRIADAGPLDIIAFDNKKADIVSAYLKTVEMKNYAEVLEKTENLIDGFQSPFGLELLATVDWLLRKEKIEPTSEAVKVGLEKWANNAEASRRKLKIFNTPVLELALKKLNSPDEVSYSCQA